MASYGHWALKPEVGYGNALLGTWLWLRNISYIYSASASRALYSIFVLFCSGAIIEFVYNNLLSSPWAPSTLRPWMLHLACFFTESQREVVREAKATKQMVKVSYTKQNKKSVWFP